MQNLWREKAPQGSQFYFMYDNFFVPPLSHELRAAVDEALARVVDGIKVAEQRAGQQEMARAVAHWTLREAPDAAQRGNADR